MRVVQVRLENDDYDRLAAFAAGTGKEPEQLAAEAILIWMRSKDVEKKGGDEILRRTFIKLRLKGKDRTLRSVAEEAALPLETVERWDREIRGSPEEWSKAFQSAGKSSDPLAWEMTLRERFYDIWGHRPQSKA